MLGFCTPHPYHCHLPTACWTEHWRGPASWTRGAKLGGRGVLVSGYTKTHREQGFPGLPWCPAGSRSCVPALLFPGVSVAHPYHQRRAAGHRHRAVLRHVGAAQRPGSHAVLLSTEHLLQEGVARVGVGGHPGGTRGLLACFWLTLFALCF